MLLARYQPDQNSRLESVAVITKRQSACAFENEIELKFGVPMVDVMSCTRSSTPHLTQQSWGNVVHKLPPPQSLKNAKNNNCACDSRQAKAAGMRA